MFYTIKYVFAIYDNKLDFVELNNKIAIKPTEIVKKGDRISSVINAKSDAWIYSSGKVEWEKMHEPLNKMLDTLSEYSEFIKYSKEKYEQVGITIFISSESAQIGFSIPNDIMGKINKLNLDLWIEIFSYGMAESE